MDANPALHPTDQTLQSYGLGKLDEASAESVHQHLEDCSDCRRRAAEISPDSFLGRLRDAKARPPSQGPAVSATDGLSMLDGGAAEPAPPPASTLPPGLADHPDYEILRELGRGGMGVVYLAQNTLMGRREVLKVVGGHLISRPAILERFLREIRSAARLQHPNIVAAYSALRFGESLVLTMEYVDGLDLSRLVKAKGPLPVANACSYVHQAALGLQHAHEHGMVHRDIKPANLILARASGKGNKAIVKVLDFGLAKVTSEGQADSGLTREGQMLGTPDYIAPEQIRDAQSADIRADIYSLGCTLYYLLTGKPPFTGDHLWDVYQAHFSMDASPLNLVRPEIPVELAAMVAKMMAKEPGRRFQEPKEVAQALAPFFKSGAVNSVGSKPDVSQTSRTVADPGASKLGAAPTQPATKATPTPGAKNPAGPTQPEPMWNSLIDLRESQPLHESLSNSPGRPVATVAKSPSQRAWSTAVVNLTRRVPPAWWTIASVLLLCAIIAWSAGVLKIRTPDGVIVLENVPADAVVEIDGTQITITPKEGEPITIGKPAGEYFVEVFRGRDRLHGDTVTLESGKESKISVTIEPLAATKTAEGLMDLPANTGSNEASPSTNMGMTGASGRVTSGGSTTTERGKILRTADSVQRVDLIELFDPASGVLGGKWTKGIGIITCRDEWGCKAIEFPYAAPEEYDFRIAFIANSGYDALQQVCYGNGHRFLWTLSGRLNSVSGFGDISGVAYESTATRVESRGWIVPGNRYTSNIEVRRDGVKAYLDGKLVSQWKTDFSDMSLPGYVRPRKERTLGLAFWGKSLTIESAELIELGRHLEEVRQTFSPILRTHNAPKPEFEPLFNGKDLHNWKTHPSQPGDWRVRNGILVGTGPGISHLYTQRSNFQNFHLRVEARYRNGSSGGIFLRSSFGPSVPLEAPKWATGYEALISSNRSARGMTGPLYGGENGDMVWSAHDLQRIPPGQWFTMEAIADGKLVAIMIDGKMSAFHADRGRVYSSGHIALHHEPHAIVEFRRIEIKEFNSWTAPREFLGFTGHESRVSRVLISSDGQSILSGGNSHEREVHSNGGNHTRGNDNTLRLWSVKTGRSRLVMSEHPWNVLGMAMSEDGGYAASCSSWYGPPNAKILLVWDLKTGRRIRRLSWSGAPERAFVIAVGFSPDGRVVKGFYNNGTITSWDVDTESEQPLIKLKGGGFTDDEFSAAMFSPDGRHLITGSRNGTVEMWNAIDGTSLQSFIGHAGIVRDLAYATNRRFILSGASDNTVRLWDTSGGTEVKSLAGDDKDLWCVAISPDSKRALSGGNDALVRLWDLGSGQEICRLEGHTMKVSAVAFSRDGHRAVSGSDDGTVRLWELP
jgi:serine/threonine protein kinase/WD40 repeat protein